MDRKSIAILLVTTSFASSAFATSMIDQLIEKNIPSTHSITKTNKSIKQTNRPYVDFTGTWKGVCNNIDMGTMVIENTSNYIRIDGKRMRIGKGLQGEYVATGEDNMFNHMSVEWNEDGSALTMRDVYVATGSEQDDNSEILTIMTKFTSTMQDGQMHIDGQLWFDDPENIQSRNPMNYHCVYTKKSS